LKGIEKKIKQNCFLTLTKSFYVGDTQILLKSKYSSVLGNSPVTDFTVFVFETVRNWFSSSAI